MAFPADPLDALVQLELGGAQTDITTDVFDRDGAGIDVARGRSDEFTQATPSTCTASVKNTSGQYSPRNPTSAYYGQLGHNTPLRFSLGTEHLGDTNGSTTASTSHVAPSITATASGLLMCMWISGGTVNYTAPGSMTAGTEQDGFASTTQTGYETVTSGATGTRTATASASTTFAAASVVAHGTITVEESLYDTNIATDVTLTTGSGTQAGWWLVAMHAYDYEQNNDFSYAPDGAGGGGWIPLADSSRIITSGYAIRARAWAKRVKRAGAHAVIFRNASSLTADNHARLFVLSGVTDWSVRSSAEVSLWPPRWDRSGNDQYTPIAGSGVLRRLRQGSSPLDSPMRRAVPRSLAYVDGTTYPPAAYWPLEDGSQSTQAASGIPGGTPMVVSGGTIDFAAYSDVYAGSQAVPDLRSSTGSLVGPVSGIDGSNGWTVSFIVDYTSTNIWSAVWAYLSSGPYNQLRVILDNTITVAGVNSSGTTNEIISSTDLSDGETYFFELSASESGGTVTYTVRIDGTVDSTGTVSGSTAGALTSVRVKPRGSGDSAGIGHVAVWGRSDGDSVRTVRVASAVDGYDGEAAGKRIDRLCREEGIPFQGVGDLDDTEPVGPQRITTITQALEDAADADDGLLYEPKEVLGIAYRTRKSLYNQTAAITLDYSAGEVTGIEAVDDDQQRRNLIVASRYDGSSAVKEITAGNLGTDTIGTYDDAITVNVQTDGQLPDYAGWRAHLGTVDEYRFPTVGMYLDRTTSLIDTWKVVEVGDLIDITNPPDDLPPNTVSQIVQGYSEQYRNYDWRVTVNCSPASPWTVGTYAGSAPGVADAQRYSPIDSSVNSTFVAGTDTSLSVVDGTGGNDLWSTSADTSFDINVAGARVRVSAVGSPSGAVQTLTVSATVVNGVNKSIPAGTAVTLWQPAVYAR